MAHADESSVDFITRHGEVNGADIACACNGTQKIPLRRRQKHCEKKFILNSAVASAIRHEQPANPSEQRALNSRRISLDEKLMLRSSNNFNQNRMAIDVDMIRNLRAAKCIAISIWLDSIAFASIFRFIFVYSDDAKNLSLNRFDFIHSSNAMRASRTTQCAMNCGFEAHSRRVHISMLLLLGVDLTGCRVSVSGVVNWAVWFADNVK